MIMSRFYYNDSNDTVKDTVTGKEYHTWYEENLLDLMNNLDKKCNLLEVIKDKQEELIEELTKQNKLLSRKLLNTEKEKQGICNTIKDSMKNERTHIGYNVLKQLAEGLEIL